MSNRDIYHALAHAGEVALLSTIVMGLIIYLAARTYRLPRCSVLRCQLASLSCSATILGCFGLSAIVTSSCGVVGLVLLVIGFIMGIVLTLPLMGLFFPDGKDLALWGIYLAGMVFVAVFVEVLLRRILS